MFKGIRGKTRIFLCLKFYIADCIFILRGNYTMKEHTIKELTSKMHITRGRVYQIIQQLYKQGKINKDADGRYILDDDAVKHITGFYKSNRLAGKTADSLHKRIADLTEENRSLHVKLNTQAEILKAKEETIQALKNQVKNLESSADALKENTDVIQKALQALDQQQKLNLLDKAKPEMEEKPKKHSWFSKLKM